MTLSRLTYGLPTRSSWRGRWIGGGKNAIWVVPERLMFWNIKQELVHVVGERLSKQNSADVAYRKGFIFQCKNVFECTERFIFACFPTDRHSDLPGVYAYVCFLGDNMCFLPVWLAYYISPPPPYIPIVGKVHRMMVHSHEKHATWITR